MRACVALATAMAMAIISTPAVAADPPKEKKICKRTDMGNTGSNLRRSSRICMTASEWKEIEDATERTMRAIRDNRGVDPEVPGAMGAGPS